MKTLNLNKSQFQKLKRFKLEKQIYNTEGALYIFKKVNKTKLLKIFFNNEGQYFGNKLLTIKCLIDKKEEINISNLVLPEKLVVVNNNVVGFSMPLIKSENLLLLLENYDVPINKKIELLKQVGSILNKIQFQTPYGEPLYLSDIHPANFIYNNEENKIYAVDLDSCKIANNKTKDIYYLETNPNVAKMTFKYEVGKDSKFIPNKNSEIFCYTMMILNTLAQEKMFKLPIEEYYSYLTYLRSLNFSYELLDNFANIYTGNNNSNPYQLIDEISKNTNYPRALFNVYKYNKSK